MIEACISAMINAGIAIESKRFCEIATNELVRLAPVAHPTPHPRNHTRALSEARLALGSSRVMHTSESVVSVAIDLSDARNARKNITKFQSQTQGIKPTIILALDLGKLNTICRFFDSKTWKHTFHNAATERNYLETLFRKHRGRQHKGGAQHFIGGELQLGSGFPILTPIYFLRLHRRSEFWQDCLERKSLTLSKSLRSIAWHEPAHL